MMPNGINGLERVKTNYPTKSVLYNVNFFHSFITTISQQHAWNPITLNIVYIDFTIFNVTKFSICQRKDSICIRLTVDGFLEYRRKILVQWEAGYIKEVPFIWREDSCRGLSQYRVPNIATKTPRVPNNKTLATASGKRILQHTVNPNRTRLHFRFILFPIK